MSGINPNTDSHNEKNYISVVFSVTIDFNSSGYLKFGRLRPSAQYYFNETEEIHGNTNNQQMIVTYKTLRDDIVAIINNEMKPIAKIASNNAVQSVDVLETREGSILVLFRAIFDTMQFVSGIKDFYESVELIRNLTNTHIRHRLDANYGNYFNVDTITLAHPNKLPLCADVVPCSKKESFIDHLRKGRDGFFYYLLIANVILFCLVVALVFKAVMMVYFT